jgi:hypothetical protein
MVERNQPIGRILLGSTVVLEVPAAYISSVDNLDRVRAGETVLGARSVV